jgi:hypothetical protein
MTAISITAANVQPGSDTVIVQGFALVALTAGQTVYRDPTTGKFGLCDVDHATAANRELYGVALNTAGINQPVSIARAGLVTIGGTVVVGTVYVAGATAGAINPTTDLASGWYTATVGVGYSATQIRMGIINGGAPVPA